MRRRTSLRGAQLSVLASAMSAIFVTGGMSAAYAQQNEQEQNEEEAVDLEEVVVTGTRIRRNDFTTPNAMSTITSEDMQNLGLVSVSDMLNQMTSNVGTVGLDSTGDGAFFVGATIANLRGMNTGFGTRTLTLVDGRRTVSSTNGSSVDLALIPSALVGRMETVTGGNGATYGSDAVAGVVNVILDRNIENVRIRAGYSTAAEGDGDEYNISIADGMQFLDGRGRLTYSFEHETIDPVLDCSTARDWCARSLGTLDNSASSDPMSGTPIEDLATLPPIVETRFPGYDWPEQAVVENLRYLHASPYGSLHTDGVTGPSPTTFFEFTADGTGIVPYQEGFTDPVMRAYAYGSANRTVIGGDGPVTTTGRTLRNGSERNNFYARFDYDINDDTSLNFELTYGINKGQNSQNGINFHNEDICIYRDNAFRQPAFMDQAARDMVAARESERVGGPFGSGGCSLNPSNWFNFFAQAFTPQHGTTLQKNWVEQLDRGVKTEADSTRFMVGADGSLFGGDTWTWDAYVSMGKSDRWQVLLNNRTNGRNVMALDSVLDVDGTPVCRVNHSGAIGDATRAQWATYFGGNNMTPTQLAEATQKVDDLRALCAPLNPFGLAASAEALAYAYDDLIEFTYSDQMNGSVSFSGSFWKGIGAGPFQLATGLDYREEETDNQVGGDPNPIIRTDFSTQYGDPWVGGNKTTDIFAELEFPLLRNKPGADYMMLNLANRRSRVESYKADEALDITKYADSWKASWVWSPTTWMRIRTTRSSDIRVPSPRELFYEQTFQGGGTFSLTPNPWRTQDSNGDVWDTIVGSNPNLRNEQSITETLGLVFTPGGWADGLQLSLDFFDMTVKDGISYATGSDEDNEDNLPYPIYRCFEHNDPYYCSVIVFGPPSEQEPNNPRSNIVSYSTTQENSEAFSTKGIDVSASYFHQLSNGGSYSIRLLGTHTLEQNVCFDITRLSASQTRCEEWTDVVGQTGGSSGGSWATNYASTPEWSGNLFGTYSKGPLSITAQARYTGAGKIRTDMVGPEDPRWGPELHRTISINRLPSWTIWNMTANYNISQSRFAPDRFDDLMVGLSIDNVFDKQPTFYSGGGLGGVNSRFFNGFGRTYRLNLSMDF